MSLAPSGRIRVEVVGGRGAPGPKGDPGDQANTYTSYKVLQASDPARKSAFLVGDKDANPRPDGLYTNPTGTAGGWVPQAASGVFFTPKPPEARRRSVEVKNQDIISAKDYPNVAGDGVTDDTAALTFALLNSRNYGREIDMRGSYAVSGLKFPGAPAGVSKFNRVIGAPIFIQAMPNTTVIGIQDSALQQSSGISMECTVVPHAASDKANPNNKGINLTGFSDSEIFATLGVASARTETTGRFYDFVYADSGSPFHYGNRIHISANSVPAPKNCLRYSDRGKGAGAAPNINQITAYINALDTVAGDTLLDLGWSTMASVMWPTLLEACPNATGIKAGNFTVMEGIWFELLGTSIDVNINGITPNNCIIRDCQFSGANHQIVLSNDVDAPPIIEHCLSFQNTNWVDQGGSPIARPVMTQGYRQPAAPTFANIAGAGNASFAADQNAALRRVDHHGRATFKLRYIVTPSATGETVWRLAPPFGFAVEQFMIGVRDITTGIGAAAGLGDNLQATDYGWAWATTNTHAVNVLVTLIAVP